MAVVPRFHFQKIKNNSAELNWQTRFFLGDDMWILKCKIDQFVALNGGKKDLGR